MTDTGPALVNPAISTPDSAIRTAPLYQCYVRLARPTLDWVTTFAVAWVLIIQPAFTGKFDVTAATTILLWAGAVYGIRTFEKTKGVS